MKAWVRKVVLEDENDIEKKTDLKPSLAEEAAAAAKAAAAAAADVAKASQEMLNSKTEGGAMVLYSYCVNLFLSSFTLFSDLIVVFFFTYTDTYYCCHDFEPLFILGPERRYFVELMSLLDVQVQEMKSMNNSIRKLEGTGNIIRDQASACD